MAHKDLSWEKVAERTFVLTMIGTVLYVAAAFIFVI